MRSPRRSEGPSPQTLRFSVRGPGTLNEVVCATITPKVIFSVFSRTRQEEPTRRRIQGSAPQIAAQKQDLDFENRSHHAQQQRCDRLEFRYDDARRGRVGFSQHDARPTSARISRAVRHFPFWRHLFTSCDRKRAGSTSARAQSAPLRSRLVWEVITRERADHTLLSSTGSIPYKKMEDGQRRQRTAFLS